MVGYRYGYLVASIVTLECLLMACAWKPIAHVTRVDDWPQTITRRSSVHPCEGELDYVPWSGQSGLFPLRTIRLNFHFMNSRDSSKNLTGETAIRFAVELVESANQGLIHNQPMRLPLDNQTPVLDPLIRYEIAPSEEGGPGIYEHFDDEYYYLVKKGKYRNNYDRSVIDRYGIGLDSILNVFVQVPPPDSMMGENYGGLKTGVALRNGIRISGPLLDDARVYTYDGMFNHEVGHILGLRHSWVRDQCEDTPEHSNCWNFTNNGSECDSLVSNNVMDSNADQNALTPCQIGIAQRSLTESQHPERNFQDQSFCLSQDVAPVRIQDTVYWCREVDVVTDVVIEKHGTLIIDNRVSMPRDGRIYIEKDAQLILKKNAVLENVCGWSWGGIVTKTNSEDQVVVERGASIQGY